jgi:myosin heavy subunit
MMDEFLHHCAVFIQKHIKRHLQEKEHRKTRLALQKIKGLVKGFKTRRLLQVHGYLPQEIRASLGRSRGSKVEELI